MSTAESVAVRSVAGAAVQDLRRRVLRSHMPGASARLPVDAEAGTGHLAAFAGAGDRLVGVVTLFAEPAPWGDPRPAWRFRSMAVEPDAQGCGVGRSLMLAAIEQARAAGAQLLWANGRDTALGFYARLGFIVHGDGFDDQVSHLPHHVVVLEL